MRLPRRTVCRDNPPVDLRRLLRRFDRGIDEDDVVVATELFEEGPEIGKRHGGNGLYSALRQRRDPQEDDVH